MLEGLRITAVTMAQCKKANDPSTHNKVLDIADGSNDNITAPATSGPWLYWDKDCTHTYRLLDWLDKNSADHQKLFSDSLHDAWIEGRKWCVAKGGKSHFYAKIVATVFSVDAKVEVWEDFKVNPDKYAKSVKNWISMYIFFSNLNLNLINTCTTSLKTKYCKFNSNTGQTGAGLKYKDIQEGSELSNLVGMYLQSWL